MMARQAWLGLILLVGGGLLGGAALAARAGAQDPAGASFEFGLIGDLPYTAEGMAQMPALITALNAAPLAFVAHDGDIKSGSAPCDDAAFLTIHALFGTVQAPLIYVPGDNEWTDCHRANNGAFDPLERLAHLRTIFFPDEQSLGQRRLALQRQSQNPAHAAYRENVRWSVGDVLFVGLHVVGSNNNLGRTPEADAEYVARNAANLAWLAEAFAEARRANHRAVMLVIQANPGFEVPADRRTGFNDFLALLEAETVAFGKPVVLVHGDTHTFRIDKPLIHSVSHRRVENFTRVETFGEHDVHWVRVNVDPRDPNVFTFREGIVPENRVAHGP